MRHIAIIGGGAAGMLASFFALESMAKVTLFEKNRQLGRKICITGKGRCNLTNTADVREFLSHVHQGNKFLYSALYAFTPEETYRWFEEHGVPLKIERGGRVFPQSDRASDVRDALFRAIDANPDFQLQIGTVKEIFKQEDGSFSILSDVRHDGFDAVIIATGGLSYPATGSTGDGYKFARKFGHIVTPLSPSLVRIRCEEKHCKKLEGLSLKNVRLTLCRNGQKKPLFSSVGELLFTDDGISGPLALTASSFLRHGARDHCIKIDLKPGLDIAQLDARILRDFSGVSNRQFSNSLDQLLPSVLRPVLVDLSGISPDTRVHQVTKEERSALVKLFKEFRLTPCGLGDISEAIITAGGVCLEEVDPHTLESRLCENLYFAGEVLDLDAYTGGYNLQIAFSTGCLAGLSAAGKKTYKL